MSNASNRVVVQPAEPPDADEVAQIYNDWMQRGGATFEAVPWTTAVTARRIAKSAPEAWFVAKEDDQVIGWSAVRRYSDRWGYRLTLESAIYLQPHAIGQGNIADRLQTCLHEQCIRCEIHHLVAKVVTDNDRSVAFHRRHGFELVGTQREIGRIDDRWIDVTIMQKIFPSR